MNRLRGGAGLDRQRSLVNMFDNMRALSNPRANFANSDDASCMICMTSEFDTHVICRFCKDHACLGCTSCPSCNTTACINDFQLFGGNNSNNNNNLNNNNANKNNNINNEHKIMLVIMIQMMMLCSTWAV